MHFSFPPVLFFGLAPFQSSHFIFPTQNSTPNMSEFNAKAPSSPWWTSALAEPEPRKGAWASLAPTRLRARHTVASLLETGLLIHTSNLPLKYAAVDPRRFLSPYSSFSILALHLDFGRLHWSLRFCDCTTNCETTDWGEYAHSFAAYFSRKFAIATSLPKTGRHASDHLLILRFRPSAICSLFIFLKPSRSFSPVFQMKWTEHQSK